MQASLFIGFFLLLATKALAGGYAGALERVWLFYAYQIDGLNDPAQRTLGRKCMSWDPVAHKCRINKNTKKEWWITCGDPKPNKRCNFSELLNFLGGCSTKDLFCADAKGVLQDIGSTDPDPEETAKRVYAHYMAQPRHKVLDWQGYRMIDQGTEEYNESINRVGDVVEKAAKAGKNTGDNKILFERFAQTTAQIKTARVGDHGSYLIQAAEERLNPKMIKVLKESVGSSGHSPVDPSKTWETVDWERTIAGAVADGKNKESDIIKITNEMKEDFYSKDQQAREHRAVIQSFEIVENKAKGCI